MRRLQLEILLGTLAVLAIVGIIAYMVFGGTEVARMNKVQSAQQAQAIEVGAALYAENCQECHGAKGGGLGQLGPAINDEFFFTERLAEIGWQDTMEEYIISTTAAGRLVASRPLYAGDGVESMAAWSDEYGGPLREDQIQNLAKFVVNWQPTALGEVELEPLEIPKADADTLQVTIRGEQVFVDVCAECHALQGLSQSEIGPDLTGIGSVAGTRQEGLTAEEYIRESVLIPNAFVVEGFEPDVISASCGGVLTEAQLDDVTSFLLQQE